MRAVHFAFLLVHLCLAQEKQKVVVAFGDSHVYYSELAQATIQDYCVGKQFIARGIPGTRALDWAANDDCELMRTSWGLTEDYTCSVTSYLQTMDMNAYDVTEVWLQMGANDALADFFNLETVLPIIPDSIVTVIGQVRAILPDVPILMLGNPLTGAPVDAQFALDTGLLTIADLSAIFDSVNAAVQVGAMAGGATYIPTMELFGGDTSAATFADSAFFVDDVHLNADGYCSLWTQEPLQKFLDCEEMDYECEIAAPNPIECVCYPGNNCVNDCAGGAVCELMENTSGSTARGVCTEESTEGPSESTEGPSTCGCGEEIGSAFSNLEEQLQTQMAALMTERLPAELETLLSERLQAALTAALPDNFVTAEDFAMLQDKVGDLEMDNNDVMNGMSDMATCMADIAGSMGGDRGDDSYEETDAPAVETAAPTEYWETIGRLMEGGNNKCSTSDADRAFRLSFTSLENCLTRCSNDARCQFASTNFMSDSSTKYCIGCINLTQAADGWMAYEMLNDRRQLSSVKQLSEVERLRAENQRLRAELAEARRN